MASYEACSQTQREFCTLHGIAYSSFCYWSKRLRLPAKDQSPLFPLIELSDLAPDSISGWRIELDLGAGIVLRVR